MLKKTELIEAAKAILTKAETENRELTTEEDAEVSDLLAKAEKSESRAKAFEKLGAAEGASTVIIKDGAAKPTAEKRDGGATALKTEQRWNDALPPSDRLDDVTLGAVAKGLALGDWSGVSPESRAALSTSANGAALVPQILSGSMFDLARNNCAVIKAGAQVMPMTSNSLRLPVWTGDPTVYWRAESSAITQSDPAVDSVLLQPKTAAVLVRVPVELLEDSPSLDSALQSSISQALALEMDRIALFGRGVTTYNEPKGLVLTANVPTTAIGAVPTYAHIRTAVASLLGRNVPQGTIAALYSARTWAEFDAILNGDQDPATPPKSFTGLQHFVTNQVPDTQGSGADSSIILGDFSKLVIGLRNDVRLEVFRAGGDGTNDALSQLEVWFRAYVRMDVAVVRPTSFEVLTGIHATA